MIKLTDLKGRAHFFRPLSIKEVRSVPDTIVETLDGNTLFVRESLKEVIDLLTRVNLPQS